MNEIKEGQEVYFLYIGHRRNEKHEPIATTVTKVGRKWFEIADAAYTRFSIETLQNDGKGFSPSSRVILSLSDYINEQEQVRLYDLVAEYFKGYSRKSIPLEKLRKIYAVLNSEQNPERSVATMPNSSNEVDNPSNQK